MDPDPIRMVSLKEEEIRTQTWTEGGWHADTARRQPPASQGERPWVSTNPAAWPWTSSLQKWREINLCCLNHSYCGSRLQLPSKLMHSWPPLFLPSRHTTTTPLPQLSHCSDHKFLWHQKQENFPGASWFGSGPSKPLAHRVALRTSLVLSGPFSPLNSTQVGSS